METLWKNTQIPFSNSTDEADFQELTTKYGYLLPYRISAHLQQEQLSKAPVKAWLATRIGQDFDLVYAEFQREIAPKYFDKHRKGIFWYVEKKEAIVLDAEGQARYKGGLWLVNGYYVNPETNRLCKN